MKTYQRMDVSGMSLFEAVKLPRPSLLVSDIGMRRVLECVDMARPLGVVVLKPDGTVFDCDSAEIVSSVQGLVRPDFRWVQLDPKHHRRLDFHRKPGSVPTTCLADGIECLREERRLEADGRADLAGILQHYHRRWATHVVPVVRLAQDAVQP